jgi:hypothetical protein
MAVAEDLRETLLLCREQLDKIDAHPIYIARLRLIWTIVQWAIEADPPHWQAALDRAERIVDSQAANVK